MLGASNMRQYRRIWQVLERPEMIKTTRSASMRANGSRCADGNPVDAHCR